MYRITLVLLPALFLACAQKDRRNSQAHSKIQPVAITPLPGTAEHSAIDSFRLHVPPSDVDERPVAFRADQAQRFRVPAGTRFHTLRGEGGTQIDVAIGDLETTDGKPVTGPVDVSLVECFAPYEMMMAGAPTCSDGRLLVSGGSFYIGMQSEGTELRLREGRTMGIRFPRKAEGPMDLFYGERGADGLVNWKPAGVAFQAREVFRPDIDSLEYDDPLDRMLFVRQYWDSFIPARDSFNRDTWTRNLKGKLVYVSSVKEIEWYLQSAGGLDTSFNRDDSLAVGFRKGKRYADFYDALYVNRLGWINCDRFLNEPQKADLIVRTRSKEEARRLHVFLVFKEINSLMPVNAGRPDAQSFRFNYLPQGYKARLVAFREEGNQMLAFASDIRIGAQTEATIELRPIKSSALAGMMK